MKLSWNEVPGLEITPTPTKADSRTVREEENRMQMWKKSKKQINSICVTCSALCIILITNITRYYYVLYDTTAILKSMELIIMNKSPSPIYIDKFPYRTDVNPSPLNDLLYYFKSCSTYKWYLWCCFYRIAILYTCNHRLNYHVCTENTLLIYNISYMK